MPTVQAQLARWRARLEAAGVESAAAECDWIYCELSGKSRGDLFADRDRIVPESWRRDGDAIVERRCRREPLQYILGHAPFMDLELEVSPAVLIPRPETELLVEFLIRRLPAGGRLLDVGTGSGAIALAAAAGRPDLRVLALDLSEAALTVAAANRRRCRLEERVELRRSDLLAELRPEEMFDAIAANLPYVTEEEYAGLQPEVRDFEPKLALTAPDAGLALILRLAAGAPDCLRPGGTVIFEIGHRQAARLTAALTADGRWSGVRVIPDYCGVERFVTADRRA